MAHLRHLPQWVHLLCLLVELWLFSQKDRRGEVNSGYSSYSVNSGGDESNEPYRVNKVDR